MAKFEESGHVIYHGDAIEILRNEITDESIDMVFVDPPYNIGKKFSKFDDKWPSDAEYAEWCYQWINECIRVLKPTGTMYLMTSTQAMPFLDLYVRERLAILSRIVWYYDSSGVQAKKYYGSTYEPILHCVKNASSYCFNADDIRVEAKTGAKRKLIDYRGEAAKPYNTKKVPGNVWEFPRVRYRMNEYEEHPSQKPEALMERMIRASSCEGDVVLDPFAGAFTTAAVGKALSRNSISIESQDEYIKIGLRRVLGMKEHAGEKLEAVKKNTKRKNKNGLKNVDRVGDLFSAK